MAWTTLGASLLLAPRIDQAVLIGVALSIAIHLLRALRLQVESSVEGDTLELRPKGVLWFGNAHSLSERVAALLQAHPEARRLRLVLEGLGRIDVTGAMTLEDVEEDARRAGVEVQVSGVPPQARGLLRRSERHHDALR